MEANNTRQRIASISAEAAEWFVRLKDKDLSAAERQRYLQWLRLSPAHIAEMLRISRLYGALRSVGVVETTASDPSDPAADSNVVSLPMNASAQPKRPLLKRRVWMAIAALFVGQVLVTGLIWHATQSGRNFETGPSEWRQIELDDRTVVRMGPRTKLRIDFNDSQRLLALQRGEATFNVAKETQRPFIVHAGEAYVRALGTEFGVMHRDHDVVVTVAEGKVAVSKVIESKLRSATDSNIDAMLANLAIPLSAGEQIEVSDSMPSTVRRIDVQRELAWADRKLIVNQTVAQAVREFNRRNRIQIKVDDPELASLQVRAVFDAGDPESFAAFLAVSAKAKVTRPAKDILMLEQEK